MSIRAVREHSMDIEPRPLLTVEMNVNCKDPTLGASVDLPLASLSARREKIDNAYTATSGTTVLTSG